MQNCRGCNELIPKGSTVVVAPRLGDMAAWHPSCFCCGTCNELLVDLVYCVWEDGIHCGRHYAEKLKPRCAACDEVRGLQLHFFNQYRRQKVFRIQKRISGTTDPSKPITDLTLWWWRRKVRNQFKAKCGFLVLCFDINLFMPFFSSIFWDATQDGLSSSIDSLIDIFFSITVLCLRPGVTREVAYIVFIVADLFSALVGVSTVSYIIQKVFQSTFRNRFRLSVCTTIFKRITGLCFYP